MLAAFRIPLRILAGVVLIFLAGPKNVSFGGGECSANAESPELACGTTWDAGICPCEPCCQESPWTVTADALFLDRRNPAEAVLIFNTANPAENLNASDFDFGLRAGPDLSLARRLGNDLRVELRYFGIDSWSATTTTATTPLNLLQVNTAVPVFRFAGTSIDATYSSGLQNVEFNGYRQIGDRWGVLAGFRYVELDEQLRMALTNPPLPFVYDVSTSNRLYGFQLGGTGTLWDQGGPWTVAATGKAGIYSNRLSQGGQISTPPVAIEANGSATQAAFVGELGFVATGQLTEYLAIRGGYRLLWVDGVALATDQVAASDFVLGQGIETHGDVFYHGAFAGLELSF